MRANHSVIDQLTTVKVPFSGTVTAATGDFDLFEIKTPGNGAAAPLRIARGMVEVIELNVAMVNETALTANEHLGMSLIHLSDPTTPANITSGSGGANAFERIVGDISLYEWYGTPEFGNGHVVNAMRPTVATAAAVTKRVQWEDGWNLQIPYSKLWLPEDRPLVVWTGQNYSEALVWRLDQAPSADIDVKGYVVCRATYLGSYD
jgi:hypothetical protein